MTRIKLTHGSARVSEDITEETKEALNKLTELAYNQVCKECEQDHLAKQRELLIGYIMNDQKLNSGKPDRKLSEEIADNYIATL